MRFEAFNYGDRGVITLKYYIISIKSPTLSLSLSQSFQRIDILISLSSQGLKD